MRQRCAKVFSSSGARVKTQNQYISAVWATKGLAGSLVGEIKRRFRCGMRCLHCGKELALLKRWTGAESSARMPTGQEYKKNTTSSP